MRPRPTLPAAAMLLCLSMPAWAAGTLKKVVVTGLDDSLMRENVLAALSVNASLGQRLGESRLEYLLTQVEPQAREALEPFGYYAASVQVDAPRGQADAEGRQDDEITVTVHVEPGEPVRVRDSDIRIEGEGSYDSYLRDDIASFAPKSGERFDHTAYETSKLAIVRRLAERGYLDADFDQRRVEVTRAAHAADIDLSWVSGIRYDMGPTTFEQDYFEPGLLDRLVYWEEGDYYHEGKLDRLRQSLVGLDYFSRIDIQPDPDEAVGGRVPVNVSLGLAKRDIYTYGLSYGTESGPGVRAGLDRRYVNSRGHKWSTQLDYADKRKQFTSLYRIPAFKWLDGWYGLGVQAYDEQTRYIDNRRLELIGSRNGQLSERLTGTVSVHLLRERWSYGTPGYEYSTLSYPEIGAQYIDVDNRLFPRSGVIANASLRGGLKSIGSDANFAQAHLSAQWHFGIGEIDRVLVRGEAGTTVTGDLVAMPPSLRFFAGGDRSVRGYAWREVGPRLPNGYALGARNVLTGSVEYEHYFGAGPWGMAVFTDAGSAFDSGSPEFKAGVGVGARWRSPIGPVRIDVGRGLDDPDSGVQLYLSIGVGL